ncbi:hypothetical protein GOODEAATRI_000884 [Goodea atripinnis]|uniref:Nipped-B protein n=1 Tax=Goodea atripinnis TaxID=208336 RepID=A0ABV0NGK9_9TELE
MLSSKAKRAKCSTHKQRVIVMLYNKVCDIVSNISELLEIQLLTDTTILQVSSMGITPFFVENVSELQLCAIKLVTAVFSRYEKHRQLILEEIFTSLARLPTSKRSLRNFRLNSSDQDGEPMYIQMVTALVLQLIQCVVHLPCDKDVFEEYDKPYDASLASGSYWLRLENTSGLCSDTGISVRKRVIKILRDICLEQPTFSKITEMCVKMIRRVNDEEGIKKLWFTPTPAHDKETMTRKILNITDVVIIKEKVLELLLYFTKHEDEVVKTKAIIGLGKKLSKQEDLKEMGDISSGMSSSIMQLYLKQVLEAFFHTESSVRHFALNVIALTLNQGLIHPVQKTEVNMLLFIADNLACFPYQSQEEPLFIMHHIDITLSVSGSNLLQTFKEKYSPTESAKVYDKAVNRKNNVNFNPRQTLDFIFNNMGNATLSEDVLMEHLDPDEEDEEGEASASANIRNKAINALLGGSGPMSGPSPRNQAGPETDDDDSDIDERTPGSSRRSRRAGDSSDPGRMSETVEAMDVIALCCPKYKDRPQIARVTQKTPNGYTIHWMAGSYSGPWAEAKKRDGRKLVPWVDTIKESDIIYKKIALTSNHKLSNKVVQTLRSLYAAREGGAS